MLEGTQQLGTTFVPLTGWICLLKLTTACSATEIIVGTG